MSFVSTRITKATFTIELEEWEARDLYHLLDGVRSSKDTDFTMNSRKVAEVLFQQLHKAKVLTITADTE